MRRTVAPELLDSDSGSAAEVAASLEDLNLINRCFGGVATLCALVERVADRTGQKSFTLLDVGAGSGEATSQAAQRLTQNKVDPKSMALDRPRTHLARGATKRARTM